MRRAMVLYTVLLTFSSQQPSVRQSIGQHHEPCQPEALVVQAEADQQVRTSDWKTKTTSEYSIGLCAQAETNTPSGTAVTPLAVLSSPARSQPTARTTQTTPNKPTPIRVNLAAGSATTQGKSPRAPWRVIPIFFGSRWRLVTIFRDMARGTGSSLRNPHKLIPWLLVGFLVFFFFSLYWGLWIWVRLKRYTRQEI
jgi:hypothetical protein